MLGFFGGVALKWYFDQDPYYLRFTNKGTGDNNYYWSEGTGLEFFVAVVFAVIFLTQTSRQTALSKDPGFQSFVITFLRFFRLSRRFVFLLVFQEPFDPAEAFISCQQPCITPRILIIAVSYGTLVTYSYVYTGGSLNPAYAFAQNFWDQVDDGDH